MTQYELLQNCLIKLIMFKSVMNNKGFEAEVDLQETPNLEMVAEKPLNSEEIRKRRVDINVLKARAKAIQDKENFKNTTIVIIFLLIIGAIGIYFSA